jgi:hypothetical protein
MNIIISFKIINFMIILAFFSCQQKTQKVIMNLPEKFTGVIFIEKAKSNNELISVESNIQIDVPISGLVDTPYYNCFFDWHSIEVSNQLNEKKLNLYHLGEVNGNRLVFFYGSHVDYDTHVRFVSPIDLKPGPLNKQQLKFGQ